MSQPQIPRLTWVMIAVLFLPAMVIAPDSRKMPELPLRLNPDALSLFLSAAPFVALGAGLISFILFLRQGSAVRAFPLAVFASALAYVLAGYSLPIIMSLAGRPGASFIVEVKTARMAGGRIRCAFAFQPVNGDPWQRICLPEPVGRQLLETYPANDVSSVGIVVTGFGNQIGIWLPEYSLKEPAPTSRIAS